jgi:putative drug exporter of the RND superfamily
MKGKRSNHAIEQLDVRMRRSRAPSELRSLSSPARPEGRLTRLADATYRRRGWTLLVWLVLLPLVIFLGARFAGEFSADYSTAGSESKAAADLVAERFPGSSGDTIDVVWQASGSVRAASVEARMKQFLGQASRLEGVGAPGRTQVSRDGKIAVARLELDRRAWDVPPATGERLIEIAKEASGDGLRIELGGQPIRNAEGGPSPEFAGLVAAAVVLLVTFGSLVAAGLPLAVALFGLGISTGLIGPLALVVDVPEWAPAVAGLMGIGVGIDYSLLVLTRFRAALAAGRDRRGAIVEAVATAGRSVLIAGVTVVISLLGLFFMGVSYLRGVALAASLAVLVVMAAAVTLLPALLAYAGERVNRLRLPGLAGTLRPVGSHSPAARWSRFVQRRPWPAALASTAILLALAAPVVGLRLGFPDAGNDQADTTTRQAYDLVARGFGPGANSPLLVAVDLPGRDARPVVSRLAGQLRAESGVAFVPPPRVNEAGTGALIAVVPEESPQSPATTRLVHRLRDTVLPETLAGSGATAHLGGATPSFVDQSDSVTDRLPLFIGGIGVIAVLLLLGAFRAPLIALKAGLMNLLSIGAAYGVVALAAEGGSFGRIFGVDTDTPVPPFIPVMMFAILFGLSMDYEVFILSRVREEYLRHGSTSRAVADGIANTARVITAAGAIMVCVFLAFLLSTEVFLKLLGLGMATAIFVDATVVRMVLVPAVMQLLGRANWWIPDWLERILPRLDVAPATALAERRTERGAA